MRMEIINTIFLPKIGEEACRALWMHGLWASVLTENKRANTTGCLFLSQSPQKFDYIRINIYRATLSVFR